MKHAKHAKSNVCKRTVIFVAGMFSVLLGAFLLVPMGVDLLMGGEDGSIFAISALISASVGALFMLSGKLGTVRKVEAMYLTCILWIVLAFLSAIPFVLSKTTELSYSDALFEAMSGLTTTGATVLCNLHEKSPGILLWRAMLNGMGGLGVITVGILLLPCLKVVGLRGIYDTESSDRRFRFSIFRTVTCIIYIYTILTVLCTVAYVAAGMSVFDAVCHALTTTSTGGFSNYDDSLGHFHNFKIEIIAIIFMLLSSCPFVAYLKLVFDGKFRSEQFVAFASIIIVASLFCTTNLYFSLPDITLSNSFRHAVFVVVSLATSTGFVSCDYGAWNFLAVLGTIMTLCGGCSGSTNSGLKIYRVTVLFYGCYQYIKGVLLGKPVCKKVGINSPQEVVKQEIANFFFLYVLVFCIACIVVAWVERDFATVLTSVSATFSNTGPGIGEVVGPVGSYAPLTTFTKFVLTLLMLVGRLEILPVLIFLISVFTPKRDVCQLFQVRDGAKVLDIFR